MTFELRGLHRSASAGLTSGESGSSGRILRDVQSVLDQMDVAEKRPLVTLTYAQSLDGCISAERGTATAISNDASRELSHSLRSMHDAILVGVNTLLIDDPQLNVRLVSGDDPRPIILDSTLRTPCTARLLNGGGRRPLIATTESACSDRAKRLEEAGAEILRCKSAEDDIVDLGDLLVSIGAMGIRSVMIEGGAKVITSVLTGQHADQVVIAIAPRFLGGIRAVESLADVPVQLRPQLHKATCESVAGDLVIHAELSTRST